MNPTSIRPPHYVLNEQGEPVPEPDVTRWSAWWASTSTDDRERDLRRVALSRVGEWEVSTVFLALDHNWLEGPPILWETMVFGPEPWDQWQDRYSSRAAAERGHAEILRRLIAGEPPPD